MLSLDKLGFTPVIPGFAALRMQNLVYQRKTCFNKAKSGMTIANPGLIEKLRIMIALV